MELQQTMRHDLTHVRDNCPAELTTGSYPEGGAKVCVKFDCVAQNKVVQVVCGEKHTVALTDEGTVFAFGDNLHGQLGLDRSFFEKQLGVSES
jgi:alpha-tubulin suppressor-like RCC1 family protein